MNGSLGTCSTTTAEAIESQQQNCVEDYSDYPINYVTSNSIWFWIQISSM